MRKKLIDLLNKHEGCELEVYKCPAGFDTIGIGRNLETRGLSNPECDYLNLGTYDKNKVIEVLKVRGITKQESDYLLSNDIDYFTTELQKRLGYFDRLPEAAKIVLVDLAFNVGIGGLLKFVNTLNLIEQGHYVAASIEMMKSKWRLQVGSRAIDLSKMLATA